MQFINEEYDAPVGFLYLLQDGFQPFLEVSAKLRSGDQLSEIEGYDLLILHAFGNIPSHDSLCQSFQHCSLTGTYAICVSTGLRPKKEREKIVAKCIHTRRSNEHWIVLRAPGQNLYSTVDFGISPNDRI